MNGNFGPALRAWRLSKELTLVQLAAKCGLASSLLSRYETNTRPISIETIDRIVKSVGDDPALVILDYLRARYPDSRYLPPKSTSK